MTVGVIQWTTGPVGAAQLSEIIDGPELELAGVHTSDALRRTGIARVEKELLRVVV
jgi:hypothetical protein